MNRGIFLVLFVLSGCSDNRSRRFIDANSGGEIPGDLLLIPVSFVEVTTWRETEELRQVVVPPQGKTPAHVGTRPVKTTQTVNQDEDDRFGTPVTYRSGGALPSSLSRFKGGMRSWSGDCSSSCLAAFCLAPFSLHADYRTRLQEVMVLAPGHEFLTLSYEKFLKGGVWKLRPISEGNSRTHPEGLDAILEEMEPGSRAKVIDFLEKADFRT